MRLLFASLLCTLFLEVGLFPAEASPWDGHWVLVRERSHMADHSFTLTPRPRGGWRYDDGSSLLDLEVGGRPLPEPHEPAFSVTATQPSPNTIEFTESGNGRLIQRFHKTLSADGRQLVGYHASFAPDGTEHRRSTVDIRVGAGSGFAGKWRALADPPRQEASGAGSGSGAAANKVPAKQGPLYWIISTAPDGSMTWHIPATGETLAGKLDGMRRPVKGPGQPSAATFAWRRANATRIEFFYYDGGHLSERATERLAADGTWSDTLWTPRYPAERDVRVFARQ